MTARLPVLCILLTLASAKAVPAAITPQQACDAARLDAWKTYLSCMGNVFPKEAKAAPFAFNPFALFAKCRHAYFSEWTKFQSSKALAGTTCRGVRFVGTATTVTDNLTALQWEMKTNVDSATSTSDVHDGDNLYQLSSSGSASDGAAYRTFLAALNGPPCFAGQCDWRMPTRMELHTILADFPCTGVPTTSKCRCPVVPCIDPTDPLGPSRADDYWSSTGDLADPTLAWTVTFSGGNVNPTRNFKTVAGPVRAVRGGL